MTYDIFKSQNLSFFFDVAHPTCQCRNYRPASASNRRRKWKFLQQDFPCL